MTDRGLEQDLLAGAVGEAAAADIEGFLRLYREMIDPDEVIQDPKKAKVPTDPATLYALCGALSARASEDTVGPLVTYANRLAPEFSVLLIRDCIERDRDLVKTRPFIEWASKHSDVLI